MLDYFKFGGKNWNSYWRMVYLERRKTEEWRRRVIYILCGKGKEVKIVTKKAATLSFLLVCLYNIPNEKKGASLTSLSRNFSFPVSFKMRAKRSIPWQLFLKIVSPLQQISTIDLSTILPNNGGNLSRKIPSFFALAINGFRKKRV